MFKKNSCTKNNWYFYYYLCTDYSFYDDCKLSFASWSGKGTFMLEYVKSNSGIFKGAVYIE